MAATRHGQTYTPRWNAWKWMRDRTTERFQAKYPTYAGVSCDQRWATYEGFLAHPPAGKFEPDETGRWPELSRIGDQGNYTPENCAWVTRAANRAEMLSRRKLRMSDGRFAIDVAAANGIGRSTLISRVSQYGWTIDVAATTPVRRVRNWRAK